MKRICLLFLPLFTLIFGCHPMLYRNCGLAYAMTTFLDADKSQLLAKWGSPETSFTDGRGGWIYTYQNINTVGSMASYSGIKNWNLSDVNTTSYADKKNLYINASGKIYDWRWNGFGVEDYILQVKTDVNGPIFSWDKDPVEVDMLGSWYENGFRTIAKNGGKAFKYYQEAANMNYGPAMYHLSQCYRNGIGTEKDLDEADKYKELAEDKGVVTEPPPMQ